MTEIKAVEEIFKDEPRRVPRKEPKKKTYDFKLHDFVDIRDIQIGDIITINRHINNLETAWIGDLFVVDYIEYPYILCKYMDGFFKGDNIKFRCLDVEFGYVTDTYKDAILSRES